MGIGNEQGRRLSEALCEVNKSGVLLCIYCQHICEMPCGSGVLILLPMASRAALSVWWQLVPAAGASSS